MEYPFPGPLTSAQEYAVIGTLFLVAVLPFVRELLFRKRSYRIDVVLGLVGLSVLGIIIATGVAGSVVPLVWLAITANLLWLILTLATKANAESRLARVAVPYGIGVVFAYAILTGPSRSGGASKRMECLNNLHQIGLALINHASAHNAYLPDLTPTTDGIPRSWRVELLPMLDRSDLYRDYQRDRPWNGAENTPFAQMWLKVYGCPENPRRRKPDVHGRFFTDYAGVRGPNTAFPDGRGATLDDISDGDGLGTTILVVEACGQQIVWTEPRDVDLAEQEIGVNLPGDEPGRSRSVMSSYHPGSTNVLFGDGSVRPLSNNIDPKVLKAILTATGGERVSDVDYMR
jgi:prepilin-type processing-associated H-X9-DG protein